MEIKSISFDNSKFEQKINTFILSEKIYTNRVINITKGLVKTTLWYWG